MNVRCARMAGAVVGAIAVGAIAAGGASATTPPTSTTTTVETTTTTTTPSTTTDAPTTTEPPTTTTAPTTSTTMSPPGSVSITLERICDVGVELLRVSFSATVDIAQGEYHLDEVPGGSTGALPTGPLAAGRSVSFEDVPNVGHTYSATITVQPAGPGAGTLTDESQITMERCPTPAGAPTVSIDDIRCSSPSKTGVILVTVTNPADNIAGLVVVELFAGQVANDTLVSSRRTFPPDAGSVSPEFDGLGAGRFVVSSFFPAGTATVYLEFLPRIVVDVPACTGIAGAGNTSGTLPASR